MEPELHAMEVQHRFCSSYLRVWTLLLVLLFGWRAEVLAQAGADSPKTTQGSLLTGDGLGPALTKLHDKLTELTAERDTLLLDLTPQHPRVQAVNERISEVLSTLSREVATQEAVLAAREETLKNTLDQLRKRLGAIPETNLALARLEREVKANEKIYTQLTSKYQEVLIKDAEKIEEISIIQPALAPGVPVNSSSPLSVVVLSLLMGVVLGSVLAFVIETFDTSFGAIEEIESALNLPVLGVIQYLDVEAVRERLAEGDTPHTGPDGEQPVGPERLFILSAPTAFASEHFRALRTNLNSSCVEKGAKALLFTSSSESEGKTTVAVNTAIAFAQAGKRTLLLDGDLRKPEVHKVFGLENQQGLTDAILGNVPWQETVRTVTDLMLGKYQFDEFLFVPGMDQLHIITAGSHVNYPPELLDSQRAEEFFAEVREHYDVILIDAPPVLAVTDAVILGSKLDGVIVVYEFGRVGRRALQRTKAILDGVEAHLYGVVINRLRAEVSPDFYDVHYYRTKYGYKYEAYGQQKSKSRPDEARRWAARLWQFFS